MRGAARNGESEDAREARMAREAQAARNPRPQKQPARNPEKVLPRLRRVNREAGADPRVYPPAATAVLRTGN